MWDLQLDSGRVKHSEMLLANICIGLLFNSVPFIYSRKPVFMPGPFRPSKAKRENIWE